MGKTDEIEREWICSSCSKKNPSYYLYCLYCGKRSENIQTCENCGKITSDKYKFCMYCGNDLGYQIAIQNKKKKEIETLSIERAIYDPTNRGFIISTQRPLPNVKSWIDKNDPSMYWLVVCIDNSADKPIDEWGIELEFPSTLKIMEARIEGTEQKFDVKEAYSKAWLTKYVLGIPHHLGIVIPRKGSKRVYFKLGSEACGISCSIKGIVSTSDRNLPIREKSFRYSCDIENVEDAIITDPKGARDFVSSIVRRQHAEKEAVRIIDSFDILIDAYSVDERTKVSDLKSLLIQLMSLISEKRLLNKIDEFFRRLVEEQERSPESCLDPNYIRRTKQFCEEFIRDWKGEFLKK